MHIENVDPTVLTHTWSTPSRLLLQRSNVDSKFDQVQEREKHVEARDLETESRSSVFVSSETGEVVSVPRAVLSEHNVQTAVDWNPSEPRGVRANFPLPPLHPHSSPFPLSNPSLPKADTLIDSLSVCVLVCVCVLPAFSQQRQISDITLGLAKCSENTALRVVIFDVMCVVVVSSAGTALVFLPIPCFFLSNL